MLRLALLLTSLTISAPCAWAQTHPAGDAIANDALVSSPWPTYHGGVARQASTALGGPRTAEPGVQVSYFREAAGTAFGTSPWHILSDQVYSNSPTARTVWGASLKYLYKYEIDGEIFRYVDSFKLNDLPLFIGWNFFALRDGRIVVPNPSGLRVRQHRRSPCAGRHASLLVFRDGTTSGSPIACEHKFEFTPSVIESACGFRRTTMGTTAVGVDVLLDGDIAARLRRETGRGRNKTRETWEAILDNAMTRIKACVHVSDGNSTNGVPMERDVDGSTIFYIATETEIIAMRYRSRDNLLERAAAVPVRYRGRTGTTPTLLGFGDDQWIITVDGRCAVTNVFSGNIECDEANTGPSELVATPRPLGTGPTVSVPLPDFIDTVENSPAVAGNDIVVSNYSGYTPDGKKDGRPDRATGIAKLSWNPRTRAFQVDWVNADIQFSGVPAISAGANLVYGSGSEVDGNTYFYGLRLTPDASGPAGEIVVRVRVGPSTETRRGAGDGVYDAGNNILINDDGSVIWPGGESLVRIRD